MCTEKISDKEEVLAIDRGATTIQRSNSLRRNPQRNRHPPLKLSLESQVVNMESEQKKIERGRSCG